MTNLNTAPRELNIDELNAVSGGAFTIDMGWCAVAFVSKNGLLTVAGGVGSQTGSVTVKLPEKK